MTKNAELLPGTLDMLILKAVSWRFPKGLYIRRSTGWSTRGSSPRIGARVRTTAGQSTTPSLSPDAAAFATRPPAGTGWFPRSPRP